MRLVLAVLLVAATAAAARADTLHLEQLNLDVAVTGDDNWTVEPAANADTIASDRFVLAFQHLTSDATCPAFPALGGAVPTTEGCPAGFTCVGKPGKPGTLAGMSVVPSYGCLVFTVAITEPDSVAQIGAIVVDVRAKIAAQHVAHVTTKLDGVAVKLAIRDPREWRATKLPATDKDGPNALLLAYAGAPARTGVALLPRNDGMCLPLAPGAPWPTPLQRETETRLGVTKGCGTLGRASWTFVILGGPGEDDAATRRWAVPALIAYTDALVDFRRPEPGERPFWGIGKLYAAGGRIAPEIDDAGAFGAGRVGLEVVVPVTDGSIAPAISFGTSLGLDGSFHLAADIYLGIGLGTEIGGVGVFATAVAGADRDGPDSSSTFGGRGYLGAAAEVHVPLGIAALEGGAMWNTIEKRLSAGVSPRGLPFGAGLMIQAYDQSTAVWLYVAITGEGIE